MEELRRLLRSQQIGCSSRPALTSVSPLEVRRVRKVVGASSSKALATRMHVLQAAASRAAARLHEDGPSTRNNRIRKSQGPLSIAEFEDYDRAELSCRSAANHKSHLKKVAQYLMRQRASDISEESFRLEIAMERSYEIEWQRPRLHSTITKVNCVTNVTISVTASGCLKRR